MTTEYHAEHVGSLLRPPWLLEARESHAKGTLSTEALREAEDRAIAEHLAMQQEAGLRVFTDGEARRASWRAGLMEALDGLVPAQRPMKWYRDGEEVPANRADVAMLLRDGALSLFADATLRPKEAMPRSHALHAIARLLEAKNLLAIQKGTSRPAASGIMMLRSNKGKDLPIAVSSEAFLFREFGEHLHQMKSLAMVGGEPVAGSPG